MTSPWFLSMPPRTVVLAAALPCTVALGSCGGEETSNDRQPVVDPSNGAASSTPTASASVPSPATAPSPAPSGPGPGSQPTDAPSAVTTDTPVPAPDQPPAPNPDPSASNGGAGGEPPSPSGAGGDGELGPGTNGGAGGSGGESEPEPITGGAPSEPFDAPFILGADISSVPEAEDNGTTYRDTDGQSIDMLSLLQNHGFNYIRLRTFVDPMAPYGYAAGTGDCAPKQEAYNDEDHTVAHAQRIKAADLGLLLDFHYSDTWADPSKQIIPESWRDIDSIDGLADAVYMYTRDVLDALEAAGALPDMVQVGNEITPGMLIHVPTSNTDCWGNNSTPAPLGGSASNWDNLATLLKAGVSAVRDVDPTIEVMLHVESTDDLNGTRSWVQNAVMRGVDFDVLGLSCYTEWQGTPSVWENTFRSLADEYPELSFVIAEYNPERREANRIMRDLPDGRGLGTFFWEPTQSGAWGEAMFDWSGNVQSARAADFAEYDAMAEEFGL